MESCLDVVGVGHLEALRMFGDGQAFTLVSLDGVSQIASRLAPATRVFLQWLYFTFFQDRLMIVSFVSLISFCGSISDLLQQFN